MAAAVTPAWTTRTAEDYAVLRVCGGNADAPAFSLSASAADQEGRVSGEVRLHFGRTGRLLTVEFDRASQQLPSPILESIGLSGARGRWPSAVLDDVRPVVDRVLAAASAGLRPEARAVRRRVRRDAARFDGRPWVEYDQCRDSAYLKLVPIAYGGARYTIVLDDADAQDLLTGDVNLDLDRRNRLVGIELLAASSQLSPEALAGARRI